MTKTKCPFWHYGRVRIITCKYCTIIKHEYKTVENMNAHRDEYCDSTSYKYCRFYEVLKKEKNNSSMLQMR